jgi:hypothetical protein
MLTEDKLELLLDPCTGQGEDCDNGTLDSVIMDH